MCYNNVAALVGNTMADESWFTRRFVRSYGGKWLFYSHSLMKLNDMCI